MSIQWRRWGRQRRWCVVILVVFLPPHLQVSLFVGQTERYCRNRLGLELMRNEHQFQRKHRKQGPIFQWGRRLWLKVPSSVDTLKTSEVTSELYFQRVEVRSVVAVQYNRGVQECLYSCRKSLLFWLSSKPCKYLSTCLVFCSRHQTAELPLT